jgi:hypothetical protein
MFKLNIECSKDFDELHIKFSDGTSVVQTGHQKSEPKQEYFAPQQPQQPQQPQEQYQPQSRGRAEQYLDTSADWGSVSQDVIEKPEIVREERGVKVAEELQNFDF